MPIFEYQRRQGGTHVPIVRVRLSSSGRFGPLHDFVVDSGAAVTVAGLLHARGLYDLETLEKERSRIPGVMTATGLRMEGALRRVNIQVTPDLLVESVPIWFSPSCRWGLLGQTFFERAGVWFENFPHQEDGRLFALFHPRSGRRLRRHRIRR